MSSSFVSRWVVARTYHPDPGSDALRDDDVEGWIAAVRDAYVEECGALREAIARGFELRTKMHGVPAGATFGRPETVVVSAGVTEVHPASFTMALRLRSIGRGEDDVAANVSCVATLVDPATGEAAEITDRVRDEMIALEHAARHYN